MTKLLEADWGIQGRRMETENGPLRQAVAGGPRLSCLGLMDGRRRMLLPFAAPGLASLFPSQHACPWQAAYHQAGYMPQALQDVRACRTGVRARQEQAVREVSGGRSKLRSLPGNAQPPLPCLRAPRHRIQGEEKLRSGRHKRSNWSSSI